MSKLWKSKLQDIYETSVPVIQEDTASMEQIASADKNEALDWSGYFDQALDLFLSEDQSSQVRIYTKGQLSPKSSVLLCHHGAGLGGLSFAVLAKEIFSSSQEFSIVAYDCRGHGQSFDSEDLRVAQLAQDLQRIYQLVLPEHQGELFLIGHSMGGSVVVEATKMELFPRLTGLILIDSVGGDSVAWLETVMLKLLKRQPKLLKSPEAGITWMLKDGAIRNVESARVSVPPLLKPTLPSGFVWKTDLKCVIPYLQELFVGLSERFLECKVPKLLFLTSTDKLDRWLVIGQMQGKYQLVVVNEAGHSIHEDCPVKVASTILEFAARQKTVIIGKT